MNDSIFAPHYDITPTIQAYLDDVERQRWLVENMLIMPKHGAWIRREVTVSRAAGTTAIEGATMDEAEVSKLLTSGIGSRPTEDERANINAIQAYEFIDFLSDQADIPIDELVIRHLNRYFIAGSPETLSPGSYRKGENKVGNFTPPNQGDVPSLMRSFALWVREGREIHPVLKAGIAHVHLVAIHPFWDGNGRTARGLSTLILQTSPFHFKKLLSLESHLFAVRDQYFTAIERTLGTGFTAGYDATPWLEYYTLALSVSAQVLADRLTDWHRMMQSLYESAEREGLDTRLVDGHAFAIRAGRITRSDYIEITGVSPVTASRDLAQLVARGFLVPEGKTRSRVYYPVRPPAAGEDVPGAEQLPLLREGAS